MVPSRQSQPLFSSDDTLEIIRSRINEKRLFEAQFLWRKLGRELTAEDRASLEANLAHGLKQVEQLRKEAQGLVARGAYEPARDLYCRVEAIAIDVPGVSEELKALAGAEALTERLARTVVPEQEAATEEEPVAAPGGEQAPVEEAVAARPDFFRRKNTGLRLYRLAALVASVLCLLLALFLYWRGGESPVPPAKDDAVVSGDPTAREAVPFPRPPEMAPPPLPQPSSTAAVPDPREDVSQQQPATAGASQADSVVHLAPLKKIEGKKKKSPPAPPPRPSMNLGGLQVQ